MTDKQLLESINQIVASQLEPVKITQRKHTVLLQEHSRILGEHSKILGEHSRILGEHSKILREHGRILGENSRDIKSLKGKVTRIDKTLNIVIRTFDERIMTNTRDIDFIKGHLGLASQQ